MNQQPIPYEQMPTYLAQPLEVQALWVSQAISILVGIGMICYFVAEVLKAGTGVFKEALKK